MSVRKLQDPAGVVSIIRFGGAGVSVVGRWGVDLIPSHLHSLALTHINVFCTVQSLPSSNSPLGFPDCVQISIFLPIRFAADFVAIGTDLHAGTGGTTGMAGILAVRGDTQP